MSLSKQIEAVKKYVALVEAVSLNQENAGELLHADYQQWELPNQLNRTGQKSDLADTLRRMQMAKGILSGQSYEIISTIEQGNTVVMEAIWTGHIAATVGAFQAGQQLKAFFCMIFTFKDGKIHRIKNYDCFEPF